jgi:hypothetical protein
MATQFKAKPLPGDELYQIRAKQAFPILVRQAHTQVVITYENLAKEMGLHPRTLNFVLGCIGNSLIVLSKLWGEEIPPLQSLVVNKKTRQPGRGGKWFSAGDKFESLDSKQLDLILKARYQEIFLYSKWNSVLSHYRLQKLAPDTAPMTAAAFSGGGPETQRHKDLKAEVASNPRLVGLDFKAGQIEYPLPSGDFVDVCFQDSNELVGVEVKSLISNEADLRRGLFQCVKYLAVMTSMLSLAGSTTKASVILLVEGTLPQTLIADRNGLGLKVVELKR